MKIIISKPIYVHKPDSGYHRHVTFSDQEQACHLAFCETAWHEIVEPKTDNNTDKLKINAAS